MNKIKESALAISTFFRSRVTPPDRRTAENRYLASQSHLRSSTNIYSCPELAPWGVEQEKIVTAPYEYIHSQPGKDFRKQFLLALNECLNIDDESFEIIYRVISVLHNSSLLIDDIQDGAILRRGQKVAHDIFGVAQTINSANFMYFIALQEASKLKSWPVAIEILNEELLNLHRGQGIEIYWRDSGTVPSEEEYLRMVSYKTGGLFALATRLMQSVSKRDFDLVPLAHAVGLIFQVRDDYLNLCSDKYSEAKGFCEDLTEGKFSFPIIHGIRCEVGNSRILEVLRLRTDDVDIKKWVLLFLKETSHSLEYTEAYLHKLHLWGRGLLSSCGAECQKLETVLDFLQIKV